MTRTRHRFRAVGFSALTIALVAVTASCGASKEAKVISGYQLSPPPEVGALSLPDASAGDTDFTFAAQTGHFMVVYFGYTQCPDVCPTTLAEVKKALQHIGDKAADVDLAMVTIDPNRDSGDLLTRYVQSFVPGSHALRTEDAERLQSVATGFGASYSVTTGATGDIEVSHSGNLYVVDTTGTVVLEWPFGLKADAIATDLEILLGKA